MRALIVGVGGDAAVAADEIAALDDYRGRDRFELIVIATKAAEALEIAPSLHAILEPSGILLPLQNGGVSQVLAERIGACVMGGLSNLGATMTSAGCYEQRNAGHLLIGELHGATHRGAERVGEWLAKGINTNPYRRIGGDEPSPARRTPHGSTRSSAHTVT